MLLHDHTEISRGLSVVGQISDLLANAHLTSQSYHGTVTYGNRGASAAPNLRLTYGSANVSKHAATSSIGTAHPATSLVTASLTAPDATKTDGGCGHRSGVREDGEGSGASALANLMRRRPADSEHDSDGVADAGAGATYSYADGLQLPRSCGPEVAAALGELGRVLRQACHELTSAVDEQLISFYEYMKRKEMTELSEMASARRIIPAGFDACEVVEHPVRQHQFSREDSIGSSSLSDTGVVKSRSRRLPQDSTGQPTATGQPTPVASGGAYHRGQRLAPMLPGLGKPTEITGRCDVDAVVARTGHVHRRKAAQPSNKSSDGALSKHLTDSRSAASTLQSFLYLLLESALTECEATTGAVYINDSGCGGDALATGVDGRTVMAKKSQSGNDEGGAGAAAPASFLQCVARIRTDGYLPDNVSYATTSTLTTIVQTGVALNLRSSAFKVESADEDTTSGASAQSAAATPRTGTSRFLNVSSCVAVPIRNFGVVVIANKCSSATEGGDFSATDEHVAWGVATLCEALFTRYRRELLLQFAWNPAGTPLLRKFTLVSEMHDHPRRRRTHSPCEAAEGLSVGGSLFAGTAGGSVLAFIAGRGFDKPAARSLAMVRTADERTVRAVPAELLNRRGGDSGPYGRGCRKAPAMVTALREDDLYEGAAQYIANLESLWRQSLSQHNGMQGIVERSDRELEARQDRIRELELKVRRLNARVIQLEHSQTLGSTGVTSGGHTRAQ